MRKALTTAFAVIFFVKTYAQAAPVYDSIITGNGNTEMVYYQLSTKSKTTSSNTNWHLAITVRPTQFPNAPLGGTSMRINEANGVHAYYVPVTDAAGFSTLDTTGWQAWGQLHDSDTAVDEGCLNSNRSTNIFDFGWGVYNPTVHNVVGDSIYLIELPNGQLKKYWVVNLDKDTAFNIRYCNIDNSDMQDLHISKKQYLGKAFVYLNLLTHAVYDKEPASAAWDIWFLKYAARDVQPGGVCVPQTGVWVNKGVTVGEAHHTDLNDNLFGGTYSANMNAIGWNWQQYDSVNQVYRAEDSLAYFIKVLNGDIYKIVFTGFDGDSGNGVIRFYTQALTPATGIAQVDKGLVSIYPNPASQQVYVAYPGNSSATVLISNLQGQVVAQHSLQQPFSSISTGELPGGLYLVSVSAGPATTCFKLMVQH